MRIIDIIEKKRDNKALTDEEINYFIDGVINNTIPDYQTSALLMAIYFNGMNDHELSVLTEKMAYTGDVIDLSKINGLTVDKHSTGGVGDKTTLIVVPIAAALGCRVTKMSGKGLGHTGGTVDKLQSIPGFKTEISQEEFYSNMNTIGAVMIGQSGKLAPADKKLYAIRDVTATVNSIPLIASSIMSKKLALGSDCIVLDVKVGSGAFMKTIEEAEQLANQMVRIGKSSKKRVSALLTNMDIPLGYCVGNTLEIIEAVNILKGQQKGDLYDISIKLAANMYCLTSGKDIELCRELAKETVEDGSAFKKLKDIVKAQGGDTSVLDNTDLFNKAAFSKNVTASESGYIESMNAELIGKSSVELGAGREELDDDIDYSAGIKLCMKTGDYIQKGETIAVLYTNKEEKLASSENIFRSAVSVSNSKPNIGSLIYKVIN